MQRLTPAVFRTCYLNSLRNLNFQKLMNGRLTLEQRYFYQVLILTRNSRDVVFENFEDAVVASCKAPLFQGKETGIQNVFQDGSFAVTERTAWVNLCVSPSDEDYLEKAEC